MRFKVSTEIVLILDPSELRLVLKGLEGRLTPEELVEAKALSLSINSDRITQAEHHHRQMQKLKANIEQGKDPTGQ